MNFLASLAAGGARLGLSAFSFAGKHWRAIAIAVPILVLAIMLHVRTGQRNEARLERDQARAATRLVEAELTAFAANVRATAAAVQRTYAQNALRVEREQAQATEEVSHDYQTRISDLHRRVAALQLRTGAGAQAAADPGGAAGDRYSALPDAAGGSDASAAQAGLPATGLSLADAVVATEQAIQLDELISWVQRQQTIVRTPATSAEPPAAAAAPH
jgi:hypothetical protein